MNTDPAPLTLAEFIAWEERQPGKYEFRAGAIYAMSGATDSHNTIVANMITIIRPTLRGSLCRVYPSDMKVVTDFPGSRYPDIIVTCNPHDARDPLIKRHPKLIIEVLSKKTAEQDATDKLDEYQTIRELEEYVLIDSRKQSVRIYRRHGDELTTGMAIISGSVTLRSLGDLEISLDEIYEDVDFTREKKSAIENRPS